MKRVVLLRTHTGEQGTPGHLIFNSFTCRTLELPWKDNKLNVSCIPEGVYIAKEDAFKGGLSYRLEDVPGRTAIEIHRGNWAGDKTLGFKCNVEGCILLGDALTLDPQLMVHNSVNTIKRAFMNLPNQFELEVKWLNLQPEGKDDETQILSADDFDDYRVM